MQTSGAANATPYIKAEPCIKPEPELAYNFPQPDVPYNMLKYESGDNEPTDLSTPKDRDRCEPLRLSIVKSEWQ